MSKYTTIKLSGGDLGLESMLVRCNLSEASAPVQVDYCEGSGWESTQYQCADCRHRTSGLIARGKELAASAVELPDGDFACDSEELPFADESDVREWIESVDETNTQPEDIADELAAAWQVVYGHPLGDEDADTQRDAWSHLCSAVL